MPVVAKRLNCLLIFILLCLTSFASADEQPHYDRIQLSAQASAAANNDTLIAVLIAQRQGSNVSKLADEVNQLVARAISRSKQVRGIEVQTLGYQTAPVYEQQHQTGWRVTQSLQLTSRNVRALSKLLGDLQGTLMLQGVGYQVSQAQRNKLEATLISKAITEFQHRAKIITHQLGRKRYRLVKMQINTGGAVRTPLRIQRYAAAEATPAAPAAIEAGKQRITVTASGTIELVLN